MTGTSYPFNTPKTRNNTEMTPLITPRCTKESAMSLIDHTNIQNIHKITRKSPKTRKSSEIIKNIEERWHPPSKTQCLKYSFVKSVILDHGNPQNPCINSLKTSKGFKPKEAWEQPWTPQRVQCGYMGTGSGVRAVGWWCPVMGVVHRYRVLCTVYHCTRPVYHCTRPCIHCIRPCIHCIWP